MDTMQDPTIAPMMPRLISKSHAETAWHCQRAEYLGYEWGGAGLRGTAPAFDLEFGTILHTALGKIALTVGQPDIIATMAPQVRDDIYAMCLTCQMDDATSKQWASIGEGMIRAFFKSVWPGILREYDVVDVEKACATLIAPDTYFIARPDLIVRHKLTGGYWYIEYKTTGYIDAKWVNSWTKAVQVHGGIMAMQDTLGVQFDGCIVIGLYKGRRDFYNQIQASPYAWGWVNRGVPGVLTDQYSYTANRGKGWERFPTWSLVDGLGPWIEAMPPEILDAQFIRTPAISLREDLVQAFFAQTAKRASETREAQQLLSVATDEASVTRVLNDYFPQSFKNCEPSFGRACDFRDICWNSWMARDPLASQVYKRRTLDHQDEFAQLIQIQKKAA